MALLLALVAGLVAAAAGTAADRTRVKSYCSPSGDVCYGIFKNDTGIYRFRLTLAAKYVRRYRVCVRPLGETAKCKSFPVRKTGASWGGTVVWQGNYPIRGPGGYRVTWLRGTQRLGPGAHVLPAGSDDLSR
jgi:hypothetical protein